MYPEYGFFQKTVLNPDKIGEIQFDVFVTGFNRSERVRRVLDSVKCSTKILINHAEYAIDNAELPDCTSVFTGTLGQGEVDFWHQFFESLIAREFDRGSSIGIDITGIMRPYILALPLMLELYGFKSVFILYSDPASYVGGSKTEFSIGTVREVRSVGGLEGSHFSAIEQDDVLIIGAGYDDKLITAAAEHKRMAHHVVLLGLPSLQPHMYQESQVRLYRASESIRNYSRRSTLFAPANDPFSVAEVLSDYVRTVRSERPEANIYLCPTGPKTQVLGFAWFYVCEAKDEAISVIFPYSDRYSPDTTNGYSCTRLFRLEPYAI